MLVDVTSAFQGFTQPLSELVDDIHRRGWTVAKIHVKDGKYLAEGKNPHGEKLQATGNTDATAAANLLVKIMRREHMRASAVKERLGAWNVQPLEQQLSAIAQAYAGSPVYDPKAAPAWMELAQDCQRRAQIIKAQITIEFTYDPIPYNSADDLREDVTKKRHITVTRAYAHHPVWSESQMLDYRLVVDVLGHTLGGADWGWHGTCLAFAQLAPLLAESPQKALFTELLGQAAFGQFYRQWGPQKIVFLEDLVEKEQAKENKPGHHGVHPSQSIVPTQVPHLNQKGTFSAVMGAPKDPNHDYESGVSPLQDNAYLWQRQNGIDPLDIDNVTQALYPLEAGVSNMHPQLVRQAVVNALRSSLLGSRQNPRAHAIHYQTLTNLPADIDDPAAFQDALDQARENWNGAQGYAPGSHKQYWPQEQQFKQWVKASNPHLDDGEVNRLAKRELLHMLMEEEERVIAADEGEQLPAEQIEHEAYEALKARLNAVTKQNVDQKVDFGDDRLFHEAASQVMYHVGWSDDDPKISSQGLLPNDPGNESLSGQRQPIGVYLWPSREAAMRQAAQTEPDGDVVPAVYEVNIAGLSLEPDPYDSLGGLQPTAFYSSSVIPPDRIRRIAKTGTYHADMYPPYLASRLRPLAQVGRNAGALAEAAREDLLSHKGHGHHFRSTALSLGIPGLGPRQISTAWLHLAPQTSQLGIIDPHINEVLGHNHTEMSNRDYFKHERELHAGRDASGYNHMPLGSFSAGLWDLKAGGPGWHPDRTPYKVYSPTPHHTIDWNQQIPQQPPWPNPYWWESTQEARDQVGQDFDRSIGTQTPKDEIPFKTASSELSPWVTHPATGQHIQGAPGTSLMQHLKGVFGHPSVQDVWAQDYEVGKGDPLTNDNPVKETF